MKLAGKVALVTGAQQGIGAAIGRALAEEGADVALTWLDDQAGAEAVANYARQAGRRAHLIRADVAKLADVESMVAETVRVLGVPDILVNNAGVYPRVKFLEMRESDWDYVLDINLKAGCFAAIAVAKALIAAGKPGGSIINLSSQSIRGAVRGVHYSASKGGVVSMTRAMALELAPHKIRVNGVVPNKIGSPVGKEEFDPTRPVINLAGRPGVPMDLAKALLFLSCDDSSFIVGELLVVDGGALVTMEGS